MESKEMIEVVSKVFSACDTLKDEIQSTKKRMLMSVFTKRASELCREDEKVIKPFISFYMKQSDVLTVKLGKLGGVDLK